jgi:hypothetical protein
MSVTVRNVNTSYLNGNKRYTSSLYSIWEIFREISFNLFIRDNKWCLQTNGEKMCIVSNFICGRYNWKRVNRLFNTTTYSNKRPIGLFAYIRIPFQKSMVSRGIQPWKHFLFCIIFWAHFTIIQRCSHTLNTSKLFILKSCFT